MATPIPTDINQDLLAQFREMRDKVASLEASQQGAGTMTRQISDEVSRVIPRKTIDTFLSEKIPGTRFYSFPNHDGFGRGDYRKINLIPDTTREDPITKRRVPIAGVWMEFRQWSGPGSEIRHPKTGRLYHYGVFDLKDCKNLINTMRTHEDSVGPKDRPVPTDKHTMGEALAAIRVSKPWFAKKVVPAKYFQMLVREQYEAMWATLERQERMKKAIEELDNPDQALLGQLELVNP